MASPNDPGSERLREILLDLNRALDRERKSRFETESMLLGLSALTRSKSGGGTFGDILRVLRGLIGFERAFILEKQDDGELRVVASMADSAVGAAWIGTGLISRLTPEHPLVFFDTEAVPEWNAQPESLRDGARSALHVLLRERPRLAVFVCAHSQRGFFTKEHARLLTHFAPLAAQALVNFDYTRELENVNERLRQEILERGRVEAELQDSYTRLKTAKDRLLQSEKMSAVGQLAAGVAHEINNPLGVILGFAQSLVRKVNDSDPLTFPIKSIERETLRCKKLVESLLIFSRQNKARMQKFDLREAIEQILLIVEAQAQLQSVEVVKELDALGPLLGDKSQMQQVIANLCSNAIDAMPDGGKIFVRARESAGYFILEVGDTGTGIPADIRNKIFDPFFTTKTVGKGTGLGLSLAYEIIQNHRGLIEVKSEVGRGSTFILSLPAEGSLPT